MKRIFELALCLCAVVLIGCDNEQADEANKWFKQPQVGSVSGTTAVVVCSTSFGEGVLASGTPGFAYAPVVNSNIGEYVFSADVTVNGSEMTCRLTGLSPKTVYVGYAFVRLGGEQLESKPVAFQTETAGEEDQGLPAFGVPASAGVTSSSATVSGSFSYEGGKTVSEAYFSYMAAGGTEQRAAVSTTPGAKSVQLTSLSASTTYTFSLCVVVDGQTYKSSAKIFTTPSGGGVTPPPAGDTKYAGWAELPTTLEKAGDYYYTSHLTDLNAPTGSKARNYSVCYSKNLMCAIWVAAPMHMFYSKKNVDRTDAYKSDPTLNFSQPGKWAGYTRGHMLGSAERLVSRKTNEQVFYYTNIAPQLSTYFNTGGGAWNTLEDWVDTQWSNSSDTTYQVIGSYWETKNKVVSGTTIPTHYYKVLLRTKGHKNKWVVDCSRDELQCIAIMVEHRTYSKAEVPKPGEYESKGMLMSVAEMEQKTGLTFFGNVPNAPKDAYNRADWGL